MNNPMRFTDPDGRSAMDTMTQLGGNWTNVGYGYFNAELGKYIDYEGNIMTPAQVQKARSYLDGGGGSVAGGGTNDSSLSPWMQVNIGGVGNFSKFDFTQFGADEIIDEEPVNFFGKSDEKVFHQTFEKMLKKFKNTKGDGIFRVFGHGNFGLIFNGSKEIYDANAFDIQMISKNENWKNVDKLDKSTLFLYTCLSATKIGNVESIAKLISIKHKKTLVVGFDGYVSYGNGTIIGVNKNLKSNDGLGEVVMYLNGKEIKRQLYKDFIK